MVGGDYSHRNTVLRGNNEPIWSTDFLRITMDGLEKLHDISIVSTAPTAGLKHTRGFLSHKKDGWLQEQSTFRCV